MPNVNTDSAHESSFAVAVTIAVHCLMFMLSLMAVRMLQDLIGTLGVDLHFWVLIAVWVLALPVFLVPSFNVFAMQVVGAKPPAGTAASYLEPMWREVLEQAGVPLDRYRLLLVANERSMVVRDFGRHVVTVSQNEVDALSSDEMTAVLAQRLGRHVGILSSIFGFALWIALPVMLWLGIGWLAWMVIKVLRGTARTFNAAGDAVNPKTNTQAGCGLALYLIGLVCFVAILAILFTFTVPVVTALVGALLFGAVERWREYHADQFAVGLGHCQQLISALSLLQGTQEARNLPQRIFSPYPAAEARLSRLV